MCSNPVSGQVDPQVANRPPFSQQPLCLNALLTGFTDSHGTEGEGQEHTSL